MRQKVGVFLLKPFHCFLKIKLEASEWPAWCTIDEQKLKYLVDYEAKEGIKLDPAKVAENPGLRDLAKLCLNSFWDKRGQRNDLPQTTVVKSRQDLLGLVTDPGVEIDEIMPVISGNVLFVNSNWHELRENISPHPNTNVVIAVFVTAQARLKLYSYLELLGERIIYSDTDSLVFTQEARRSINRHRQISR